MAGFVACDEDTHDNDGTAFTPAVVRISFFRFEEGSTTTLEHVVSYDACQEHIQALVGLMWANHHKDPRFGYIKLDRLGSAGHLDRLMSEPSVLEHGG